MNILKIKKSTKKEKKKNKNDTSDDKILAKGKMYEKTKKIKTKIMRIIMELKIEIEKEL